MPLAKNRELITVTDQAHKHLRDVVNRMKRNGIPINGSMLASQAILAIPLPAPVEKKRAPRRKVESIQPVAEAAL